MDLAGQLVSLLQHRRLPGSLSQSGELDREARLACQGSSYFELFRPKFPVVGEPKRHAADQLPGYDQRDDQRCLYAQPN